MRSTRSRRTEPIFTTNQPRRPRYRCRYWSVSVLGLVAESPLPFDHHRRMGNWVHQIFDVRTQIGSTQAYGQDFFD